MINKLTRGVGSDDDDDISFDDIEPTSKSNDAPVDDSKVKELLDSLD